MRSLRALYTIGAHTSIVSDVSFYRPRATGDVFSAFAQGKAGDDTDVKMETKEEEPEVKMDEDTKPPASDKDKNMSVSGLFLVSSGYDGIVKLWSADDWQLVKALSADAGKVMSADISPDGEFIASGSWNRSYQIFSMEG